MVTMAKEAPAYFIKLGERGAWESESLDNGIIRFGYSETPHDLCVASDWDQVWEIWYGLREDAGTATRDVSQIRTFYEADKDSVFITFHGGQMYWCHPGGPVEMMDNHSHRMRRTLDGWHRTSIGGKSLEVSSLSGHLTRVQMFRGTICSVKAREYLYRKINDITVEEVQRADEAEVAYSQAVIDLMRLLGWKDFELIVDLVFASSGWRRISGVGKTQKYVDIVLFMPTTGERAFVQVKAETSTREIREYLKDFNGSAYDRMFMVWHQGNVDTSISAEGVNLIDSESFARMVIDAGLVWWLKEKVS